MSTPSRERKPVEHGVWFPSATLETGQDHIYQKVGNYHHIVQNLDVAFSFRHLASVGVEEER
jgi:hypothetical protein